ncbi:Uncharacterised protein [Mycobacteroides abscessus subsp. abscessus]|nr:Uncharacterised protein [Mycobacteroides abscessus subsp. abscessus]
MPMAMVADVTPGPRIATIANASNITGNEKTTSITRISTVSVIPPANPDTMPMITPATNEIATAITATRILTAAARTTRENTSRPRSSVPNRCEKSGACSAFGTSMSLAPYGAMNEPKIARMTIIRMTTMPTTDALLRSNSRHAESVLPVPAEVGSPASSSAVCAVRSGSGSSLMTTESSDR